MPHILQRDHFHPFLCSPGKQKPRGFVCRHHQLEVFRETERTMNEVESFLDVQQQWTDAACHAQATVKTEHYSALIFLVVIVVKI